MMQLNSIKVARNHYSSPKGHQTLLINLSSIFRKSAFYIKEKVFMLKRNANLWIICMGTIQIVNVYPSFSNFKISLVDLVEYWRDCIKELGQKFLD